MLAVVSRAAAQPPPPLGLLSGELPEERHVGLGYQDNVVHMHMQQMKQDLPSPIYENLRECTVGEAGFAYDSSNDHASYAEYSYSDGHKVGLVMYGKIANEEEMGELYGLSAEESSAIVSTSSSARLLLSLYLEGFVDAYGDASSQPQTCLESLEGSFAFVLFDASCQYLLAVRDSGGKAPLLWGTGKTTGAVLFASHPHILTNECSSGAGAASEFPAGCFYENDDTYGGLVRSYTRRGKRVQGMPRVNSHGQLCGTVFRVVSGGDLAGLVGINHPSGSGDVTAQ